MTLDDTRPSPNAYLVTAPTHEQRQYDLTVHVPRLRPKPGCTLHPWVRVIANCETGEVTCAAGMKVLRKDGTHEPEDDGA